MKMTVDGNGDRGEWQRRDDVVVVVVDVIGVGSGCCCIRNGDRIVDLRII